jgi:iron complex outermembrane receptor protein
MSQRIVNRTLSAAIVAALYASASYAQQPAPQASNSLDEVIVTGSYIRGTPEDAALPVDVITAEDLAEQGSPTVVQLVKTLTASQSAIGESNRYNVGAGTAQINLRGFGAGRTLTLLNSRRLADNPLSVGANLNFIPQAAVGRMEMLKDGAAATYGSDAIGGVVNFITRRDLDGVEVEAEYSLIDGSNGDYQASIAWGSKFDSGNFLLTAGYRHRSRLDIHERSWALAPYEDQGYGGWTGAGNPGAYVANTTGGAAMFRDNGCAELGGVLTTGAAGRPISPTDSAATVAGATCRFQFSSFNDLVNDEDHYQVYGELNKTVFENIESHTELAWARDYVPMQRLSPANLTAQYPTPITAGGTSGSVANASPTNGGVRYNVPTYHPGLIDLRTSCPAPLTAGQCTAMTAAGGVDISQLGWRAIAFAGHPTNADKADHQVIDSRAFRVSTGLKGTLFEMDWDTALTYMQAESSVSTNDLLVNRIQNALNGFASMPGSPDTCTAADQSLLNMFGHSVAQHAALGCYFFNPFSNSVAVSAVNGVANPYYRAAVANDPRIVESLYGNYVNDSTNDLLVFDGVLSGQLGFELPGGKIGWAAGVQWRQTSEKREYGDLFNTAVNPCVDSIDDGTPACNAPAGPLIFFGSNANSDYTRDVYAVFGEVSLPIVDTLDVSLAARFESYPGDIGTTLDPKFSVRWQALEWFALRGSAGTTFRAPGLNQTDPGCSTGVANISGQYRAVENCGNDQLVPETANTYNVGFVLNPGNFTATVDYFLFNFEGELTQESAARMNATLFPTGVNTLLSPGGLPNPAHPCNRPEYLELRLRFNFAGDCGVGTGINNNNTTRIRTYAVNGPDTDTSGLDVRLQYDWLDVQGGRFSIGAEGTYLFDYERGEFSLKDNPGLIIAAPEDRAGLHDLVAQFFSYPKLRANGFASYNVNDWTVRWQIRYTEGTEAAFSSPTSRWVTDSSSATGYSQELLGKSDDFIQHDVTVRWNVSQSVTLTGSIQNLLEQAPSDAPSQYNYDYTNGNPLGRVFELAAKVTF